MTGRAHGRLIHGKLSLKEVVPCIIGQAPKGHRQQPHDINWVGIYSFLLCCRCYVPASCTRMTGDPISLYL